MESIAVGTPIISDISDGHYVTGSYVTAWFQPVSIPEIYGARNLGLDPNNIEYYLISEEERQRRLERERSPFHLEGFATYEPQPFSWIDDRDRERQMEWEFEVGPEMELYIDEHQWGPPEGEDEET